MIKRRNFIMAVLLSASILTMTAEGLTLTDITSGKYAAAYVSGINAIEGTDDYARMSDDGRQVLRCSFKNGEKSVVLFSADAVGMGFFSDYILSPDGKTLLIETNKKRIYRRSFTADYYIYNVDNHQLVPLSENGSQQVPTFSPDSKHIAFVRDNNIFIRSLMGTTDERQVTTDGLRNEVINGIPDWVNEEEFGFNNAMAWTYDSKALCWIRYDESQVRTCSLQLFKGDTPAMDAFEDYPGEYSYKYPKAGQDNSVVTAWSFDLEHNQTRQLLVPINDDGYIPRIKTMPGQQSVIVYTMNRHQDVLNLYAANVKDGTCRLLICEQAEKYVKEEAMEGIQITERHILLPSDRNGFMHLYLYGMDGRLERQVENGNYDVTAVYGYDEKTGNTYFQAALPDAMNRQVCVVDKRGERRVLTEKAGWNSADFSGNYRHFINTWSDAEHPYVFTVRDDKGRLVRMLEDNHKLQEDVGHLQLPKKEFFSFTTSEGVTLNGWMVKPQQANESCPVVMYQYSGPGSQQVVNSWRIGSMGQGAMFDYYLVQQGFIVACVDGRGTGGRGSDFEKCTYLHIGELEAKDQVEAALYLSTLPEVDGSHIGIWGWSYGGFCTLMSMSEGRPVFKAGVAVAPPTNWRYYDSVYTERYMRTPQENADGYAVNPTERAAQLSGSLLLCHGVADDNVHPQNTFEYAEALVQADKDFKENLYTNRNHSIYGGNTRNHLLRQIVQHFEKELK